MTRNHTRKTMGQNKPQPLSSASHRPIFRIGTSLP